MTEEKIQPDELRSGFDDAVLPEMDFDIGLGLDF